MLFSWSKALDFYFGSVDLALTSIMKKLPQFYLKLEKFSGFNYKSDMYKTFSGQAMESTYAPQTLTRKIRRIAATPDVAMTLALLGTRLSSVGMMASAP